MLWGVSWRILGALEALTGALGVLMGAHFWYHFRNPFWYLFCCFLGSFGDHFELLFGTIFDAFGLLWGSFWVLKSHLGV